MGLSTPIITLRFEAPFGLKGVPTVLLTEQRLPGRSRRAFSVGCYVAIIG